MTSLTPGDTLTAGMSTTAGGQEATDGGASLLPEDPASDAASPSPTETAICDPRTGVDHCNANTNRLHTYVTNAPIHVIWFERLGAIAT